MKRISILLSLAFLFGMLTFTSCKKDKVTSDETIEAVISADQASNDGIQLADNEASADKATTADACYSVQRSIDFQNRIGTIIITFNGEVCQDSVYRSGTITITWDLGWRINPDGKSLTITYENFVRGDKIFNGTISYSISLDTSSTDSSLWVPVMTATYQNFTVTFPDSTQFTITGTRSVRHEGFFSFNIEDKALVMNSSLQGTSRNGDTFTVVDDNVTSKFSCRFRFPVSGTKTIVINDDKTYIINFGDGTCDRIYTVTVDGKTETREWHAEGRVK